MNSEVKLLSLVFLTVLWHRVLSNVSGECFKYFIRTGLIHNYCFET